MFQLVIEYGYFVQSFQKVEPGSTVRLTLMPGFAKLRGDRVAGVLVPVLVDGDQVVLEIGLAGFRHQRLCLGRIAGDLRQFHIFRMDRRRHGGFPPASPALP